MKNLFLSAFLCICALPAFAVIEGNNILISTPNTSMLLNGKQGEVLRFAYYGDKVEPGMINSIKGGQLSLNDEAYPVFGVNAENEPALQVTHADGNMSLDLIIESISQSAVTNAELTKIVLKDKVYPFVVTLNYKAYKNSDVIECWSEFTNNEKKAVTLYKFASAFLPVRLGDLWLTHLDGAWASEAYMTDEALTPGIKILSNRDGVRNTLGGNPSFMLSLDGKPSEGNGRVIGGALAYSGNYKIMFDISSRSRLNIFAGINEDASQYILEPKETFTTPELALTYSKEGKGGVSRSFHDYARNGKLHNGLNKRDILLNSWEGVYFNVNQEGMDQMMKDFSEMGGELFVMDDGWFGDKYPRDNDKSSLGDWVVAKKKLPQGVEGLIASAKKYGIKFGIWIEPEMCNSISELYEKHPDWIIRQSNREPRMGRGGTQLVLDLSNPKVQDFVFGVVDGLMTNYPDLYYIKWDANMTLANYGSNYLAKNKQSHLYIEFHKGLRNVLERIRAKYPNLVMQACASGGGRANYGLLPYFDEFWGSDNTDALQRMQIQWGESQFYPANAIASHVSANKNHQTQREVPLKLRFDVAMTGRLGMEIQPKDMTEADKIFAKNAIATYKSIRPVIQQGDQYRLVSPFEKQPFSSLMYVSKDKSRAVFFTYKLEHFVNQYIPRLKMDGLNPDKMYKITEINMELGRDNTPGRSRNRINNQVVSGKQLMEEGIEVSFGGQYSSVVFELNAQ